MLRDTRRRLDVPGPLPGGFQVLAVEVGTLGRAVVAVGDARVGSINMTSVRIHDEAVGEAIGHDCPALGAIRADRVNVVATQFEKEYSAGPGRAR